MPKYLVTYDLRQEGQDYRVLSKRLKELGAIRPLFSAWVLETYASAAALREDLVQYIDANDGLLVVGLNGEGAWRQLEEVTSSPLKELLQR